MPYTMGYAPHSEQLPITKPPENLNFGNEIYDFDEDLGQQGRDNIDYDPTFESSYVYDLNHIY